MNLRREAEHRLRENSKLYEILPVVTMTVRIISSEISKERALLVVSAKVQIRQISDEKS